MGLHQEVAAAINQGLLMSPSEKVERHAKLYKVVTTHTSHSWASILVKRLLGQLRRQGMARQTPYILKHKLEQLYTSAKKRLFLFDYDVSSLLTQLSMISFDVDYLILGVLGYPHSDCEDAFNGRSFECNIGSSGETC